MAEPMQPILRSLSDSFLALLVLCIMTLSALCSAQHFPKQLVGLHGSTEVAHSYVVDALLADVASLLLPPSSLQGLPWYLAQHHGEGMHHAGLFC